MQWIEPLRPWSPISFRGWREALGERGPVSVVFQALVDLS